MTEQEYIILLTDNIAFQLRHANYSRTVDIRQFAHMITTGEGQDAEVTRYRRFEDAELKKQRVRLYNPLTKYALARPRKYWKNLNRVEGIRRTFTGPEDAVRELQDTFYNFMPGQDLEAWQNQTLEYLGVTDPNAWIVYERRDQRNEEGQIAKTTVYPFVVPSVDAVNYSKTYGTLDWLLARTKSIETTQKAGYRQERLLENYYLYAPGLIVRAREIGEKTVQEGSEYVQEIEVFPYTDATTTTSTLYEKTASVSGFARNAQPPGYSDPKTRSFYISVIYNGTDEVPAMSAGAYMDEVTGADISVAWFDPAEDVFRDLIRDKSVSDVLTIVHAYPKTWEFAKRCTFHDPQEGQCEGGWLNGITDESHRCPQCKGTGIPANFTTEQETLQIPLPENIDGASMLELAKLSFTQPVDIALLQHIDNKIEGAEGKIMAAVFDSGLYQKPTDTKSRTATEVNAVLDGIADVLYPFCNVRSRHYELAYRVGAQYREIPGFTVDHSFPEDLKIETLADMVATFETMKASGVGYEALVAQRKRVFQKQFEGSPEVQNRIAARYKFLPFDDKSPEDSAFILAGLSPTDNNFVLWAYWRQIFLEIEEENPAFADMAYARQKAIVQAKVDEIKQGMALGVEPIGAPEPDFNEPTESE